MKLFKNMMSRKPDPEEIPALDAKAIDERTREATADDTGRRNGSVRGDDLYAAAPEQAVPAADDGADGWSVASWDEGDDDENWDDEDWGEDWDDDDEDAVEAGAPVDPKAALVAGIRDAARDIQGDTQRDGIRNWSEDEEFDRRHAARSRLGAGFEDAEERILAKTNSEMTNIMSSRRRSAMAHLKKAAQATKADRVLSHVVGRDASADPDEQSPYRDDLAKVVKPRATSRPVSRPVSRSPKVQAAWESGPSDADAAMMAEASDTPRRTLDRSIFEEERQQHLPADLTEDEFTSDEILVPAAAAASATDAFEDEIEEQEDDDRPRGPASWSRPIFEDDDGTDEARAVAVVTRRASRVRSSLVDPIEEDESADEPARPIEEEVAAANWGLGGRREDEDDEDDLARDQDEPVDLMADADAGDDADEADVSDAPPASAAALAMRNGATGGIDLAAVRNGVSEMASPRVSTPSAAEPEAEAKAEGAHEPIVQVPTPAIGRAGRSAGRVKTRLLGFQAHEHEPDVFEKAGTAEATGRSQFPVGWIVVVEGPGRGQAFTLQGGVMQIGRGKGQGVQLDFGDTAISRENHAAVAFDDETGKFFLGHGGKSNLVRRNGTPVLSTEELRDRDRIRIGETTLMLVTLCHEDFLWGTGDGTDDEA